MRSPLRVSVRSRSNRTRRASVLRGAGRQKAGAAINFAVALSNIKKVDERIERGDPLLLIHARNDASIRSVLPLL